MSENFRKTNFCTYFGDQLRLAFAFLVARCCALYCFFLLFNLCCLAQLAKLIDWLSLSPLLVIFWGMGGCTNSLLMSEVLHPHLDPDLGLFWQNYIQHFSTVWFISWKADRIFMTILSEMHLWTKKSPMNFESHRRPPWSRSALCGCSRCILFIS